MLISVYFRVLPWPLICVSAACQALLTFHPSLSVDSVVSVAISGFCPLRKFLLHDIVIGNRIDIDGRFRKRQDDRPEFEVQAP